MGRSRIKVKDQGQGSRPRIKVKDQGKGSRSRIKVKDRGQGSRSRIEVKDQGSGSRNNFNVIHCFVFSSLFIVWWVSSWFFTDRSPTLMGPTCQGFLGLVVILQWNFFSVD